MKVTCCKCKKTTLEVESGHELQKLGWYQTREGWLCPHCRKDEEREMTAVKCADCGKTFKTGSHGCPVGHPPLKNMLCEDCWGYGGGHNAVLGSDGIWRWCEDGVEVGV